jgi:hypothetical protein
MTMFLIVGSIDICLNNLLMTFVLMTLVVIRVVLTFATLAFGLPTMVLSTFA